MVINCVIAGSYFFLYFIMWHVLDSRRGITSSLFFMLFATNIFRWKKVTLIPAWIFFSHLNDIACRDSRRLAGKNYPTSFAGIPLYTRPLQLPALPIFHFPVVLNNSATAGVQATIHLNHCRHPLHEKGSPVRNWFPLLF